jgi:hypothetical protein
LLWIGDEREHLHRGAAAVAAKGVHLVDLGQQSRPDSRRFLRNGCRPRGGAGLPGGDGLLRVVLGGFAETEGGLLLMLLFHPWGARRTRCGSRIHDPPGSGEVAKLRGPYQGVGTAW